MHCLKKVVSGCVKGIVVNDPRLRPDLVLAPIDAVIDSRFARISRPPMLSWTSSVTVEVGRSSDNGMVVHPSTWTTMFGDCDGGVCTLTPVSDVVAGYAARMPFPQLVPVDELKSTLEPVGRIYALVRDAGPTCGRLARARGSAR